MGLLISTFINSRYFKREISPMLCSWDGWYVHDVAAFNLELVAEILSILLFRLDIRSRLDCGGFCVLQQRGFRCSQLQRLHVCGHYRQCQRRLPFASSLSNNFVRNYHKRIGRRSLISVPLDPREMSCRCRKSGVMVGLAETQ